MTERARCRWPYAPMPAPRLSRSVLALFLPVMLLVLTACSDADADAAAFPEWIEAVYPQPDATLAVPDAIEVDHRLEEPETEVRLLVDGVDVTTYSNFEGAKIRYEPGFGPVDLGGGDHTAEVQRVSLPVDGTEYVVVDSYSWEFRTG